MVVPMPLKSLINNSATMTPEPKKKVESHRVKCFHRKHRRCKDVSIKYLCYCKAQEGYPGGKEPCLYV